MKTHTPAPWNLRSDTVLPDGTKTESILSNGTFPSFVCHCEGDNRKPNAKLIAAAPELLEACKQGLRFLNQLGYNSSGNTPESQLRAAIDKAS